jgi:hypothetical protein
MPRGDEVYVSKWLKASDLEEDEATFTITGSDITTFKERSGQEKQQIYLEFQETEKPLGLNKTNYSVLQSIFRSPETDDWIGKKIVVFVTQCQMPDGSMGDCIRIKRKATETINAKPARKLTAEQAAPPPARPRPPRATAPVTQQEADSDEDIPFNEVPY